MKNLKKLLAVIIALAMMATMMVPAFAEDEISADAQTCANLGVLLGEGSGVTSEYLAKETVRIQAALISLRLLGKEAEAQAFEDWEENFTDADEVWSGGRNALAYLKANPDLGWDGNPDGSFAPNSKATAQMIYKVLLEVLGYKAGEGEGFDFDWNGTIEFAADKGLTKIADVESVTNNDLAIAMVEALKAEVKEGGKTLAEKLVEDGLIDRDQAIAEGLIEDELKATAAATGARKLTVTFNKAVDTTKATFAVKRGTIAVNIADVAFAEDKKSADLTLAAKLMEGDYTITISGLTDADLTVVVAGVKDEAPTQLEITADQAAAVLQDGNYKSAKISYKVYNQYGDDITAASTTPEINWTSTIGTAADANDGVITITNNTAPYFTVGQTINLTGVMTSYALVASKTITIGLPSSVDSVTFGGLYNADDETIATGFADDEFYVLLSAKDQYGNDLSAADINNNIVATSTNPTVFTVAASNWVEENQGPDGNQLGIALKAPATSVAGTANLRLISKTTGKVFEYPITVAAAAVVDVFEMSAPSQVIAADDDNIEIPFTAIDSNGNAVTSFAALNGVVTFPSEGGNDVRFVNDYVNNKAVLYYDAPATAGTYIIMALTPTGKTSQLTVTVRDAAEAKYISALNSSVVTNVAVKGTVTLGADSFVVKDDYGRDYTLTVGAGATDYSIVVENNSGTDTKTSITSADGIINGAEDTVVITGASKGTSTYTAYLKKGTDKVSGSEFTFRVTVVDKADIVSYELADIPTMYDNGKETPDPQVPTPDAYKVDLTVYGLKADGTKVAIPGEDIEVVTTNSNLTYAGGKLHADGYDFAGNDVTEYSASVIVTVSASETGVVITKPVKVSNATPVINALAYNASYAGYVSDGVISVAKETKISGMKAVINGAVTATDQYGVEFTEAADTYSLIVTNFVAADDNTLANFKNDTVGLDAGDIFHLTAVTANGKTIQFKVIAVE